jgi:hypothetical protein
MHLPNLAAIFGKLSLFLSTPPFILPKWTVLEEHQTAAVGPRRSCWVAEELAVSECRYLSDKSQGKGL